MYFLPRKQIFVVEINAIITTMLTEDQHGSMKRRSLCKKNVFPKKYSRKNKVEQRSKYEHQRSNMARFDYFCIKKM